MRAAISADIVSSTSLSSEDLSYLREELTELIKDFEMNYHTFCIGTPINEGFWGRIVKGDSIECYLSQVNWSLRVALALKLKTKIFVAPLDCSKETKTFGLRFAIGAGEFKKVDKETDIIDGEPIYLSGREMQKRRKINDKLMFLTEEDLHGVGRIMNDLVVWLDDKVNDLKTKQCEAVFYKLMGDDNDVIQKRLSIKQNTLSSRLKSADWKMISSTVRDFERLNFDDLWFTLS